MDNISVYYTHTFYMYKVSQYAPHEPKRACERRGSLAILCSPSCPPMDQAICEGGEAGHVPSLSPSAASERKRRPKSSLILLAAAAAEPRGSPR